MNSCLMIMCLFVSSEYVSIECIVKFTYGVSVEFKVDGFSLENCPEEGLTDRVSYHDDK